MSSNILIIPDAHAHPKYTNERFLLLGQHIAYYRPDYVVCLGDFADMVSLSSHAKNSEISTAQFQKDLDVTEDAHKQLKKGMGRYKPPMLMCLGNHEDRINRWLDQQPKLQGFLDMSALNFDHYWDKVVDFQEILKLEGFIFSHHFASGLMNRPIGGMNPAGTMVNKLHQSAVAGHSHIFDVKAARRPDRSRFWCFHAGCFVSQSMVERWNKGSEVLWDRGVLWLNSVSKGDCSFEWVRMEDM